MRYWTEPKYRKYVKGYGFLSFSRIFGDKYGKKLMDTATKTEIDAAKTASKRVVQEEATWDLIWKKIADNESSKFATRKWYVINDQNNTDYGEGNEDSTTVKFETKVIKSNLCDYSDTYILVTGDITSTGGNANTRVAFKNCAPFTRCTTHINDEHIDNADNLDIIKPMYNLIEYNSNYSDNFRNFMAV